LVATTGHACDPYSNVLAREAVLVPVQYVARGFREHGAKRARQAHVQGFPDLADRRDHMTRELMPGRRCALGQNEQFGWYVAGAAGLEHASIRATVYSFVIHDCKLADGNQFAKQRPFPRLKMPTTVWFRVVRTRSKARPPPGTEEIL
jgi:hypothetical protein